MQKWMTIEGGGSKEHCGKWYTFYICNFLLKPRSGGPRRPRIYHLDKLSRNYNNLLNSENYHLNHFVARSHSFLQSLAEVILLTLLSKDVVY